MGQFWLIKPKNEIVQEQGVNLRDALDHQLKLANSSYAREKDESKKRAARANVIFIFPGDQKHHKETRGPFTGVPGAKLAAFAHSRYKEGYGAMSLPTMEKDFNAASDDGLRSMEREAILDLWKLAGAGFDFALPVRYIQTGSEKRWFGVDETWLHAVSSLSDGLPSPNNEKNTYNFVCEPRFFGGTAKSKKPHMATVYYRELNCLKEYLANSGGVDWKQETMFSIQRGCAGVIPPKALQSAWNYGKAQSQKPFGDKDPLCMMRSDYERYMDKKAKMIRALKQYTSGIYLIRFGKKGHHHQARAKALIKMIQEHNLPINAIRILLKRQLSAFGDFTVQMEDAKHLKASLSADWVMRNRFLRFGTQFASKSYNKGGFWRAVTNAVDATKPDQQEANPC